MSTQGSTGILQDSTSEDNGTKASKGASPPTFLPLSFFFVIRVAPF